MEKKQSGFAAVVKSLLWIGLYPLLQLSVSLTAQFSFLLAHADVDRDRLAQSAQDFVYANAYFFGMIAAALLLLILAASALKKKRFRATFSWNKAKPSALFGALFGAGAAFLAAMILIEAAYVAIPAVAESADSYLQQQEALEAANAALWPEMLFVCLIGPVAEEFLCRGVVLSTLRRSFSPTVSILICGVLFGVLHQNLYQAVFTVPFGALLAYLVIQSGSIFPAILLHAGFNAQNYLPQVLEAFAVSPESDWYVFLNIAIRVTQLAFGAAAFLLFRHAFEKERSLKEKDLAFRDAARREKEEMLAHIRAFYGSTPQNDSVSERNTIMAPEFLIVGLGNPGPSYAANRHNCGFIAADYIALREHANFSLAKHRALIAPVFMENKPVWLVKPQTFMNNSGESVGEIARYYKIPPEKILVLFDDINFDPGHLRVRKDGSAGGHNGIKSLIAHLGSESFPRVKIGVGKLPEGADLVSWVLSNPAPADTDKILSAMEGVYHSAKAFLSGDLDHAMSLYNGKSF